MSARGMIVPTPLADLESGRQLEPLQRDRQSTANARRPAPENVSREKRDGTLRAFAQMDGARLAPCRHLQRPVRRSATPSPGSAHSPSVTSTSTASCARSPPTCFVSQDEPRVERHARQQDGWVAHVLEGLDRTMTLAQPAMALRLSDVYERIDFPPIPGSRL